MEALKLAFDTVIVGALALPWLAFILDLALRPRNVGKYQVWSLWSFLKGKAVKMGITIPSAVAGVLLFVAAYFVGVVVTRASGDFFNDEMPRPLPTEDHIRTAAYCDLTYIVEDKDGITKLIDEAKRRPPAPAPKAEKTATEKTTADPCGETKEAEKAIQRLFQVQEAALLLEGGDKTDRLNQLHSQILVLRGAAFNGLLTFMLCLFGLGGSSKGNRMVWSAIPLITLGLGVGFLIVHVDAGTHADLTDPPFMELTLILLGLVGGYVLWSDTSQVCCDPSASPTSPFSGWRGVSVGKYFAGFLLSLVASLIAFLGWWCSELLYDQQVFYSFYARSLT